MLPQEWGAEIMFPRMGSQNYAPRNGEQQNHAPARMRSKNNARTRIISSGTMLPQNGEQELYSLGNGE